MPLAPPDAAQEVLATATAALAEPPANRGVVLSEPAIDCDLLTVHLGSLEMLVPEEGPLAPMSPRPRVSMVTLVVTLAECVAAGDQVDVATTEIDALRLAAHAWAIWRALASHDFGGCSAVSLGPALPLPEEGGYAGWLIPVRLQVE